jgi:hypothetical protein
VPWFCGAESLFDLLRALLWCLPCCFSAAALAALVRGYFRRRHNCAELLYQLIPMIPGNVTPQMPHQMPLYPTYAVGHASGRVSFDSRAARRLSL